MAFTKKTKATPKPASYARKSKKHEEVEVEETEIEEQESDYEDAPEESEEQAPEVDEPQGTASRRGAGGYQSNNYARPNRPPQSQGRPSYGQRNTPQGDGKGVRVTGLFAGKREGLWTGRLRKEDIENLMGLFDNALSSNQLVTMFLWENQDGPQFSLTANLAQEFKGGGGNRFNRGHRGSIGRR